MITPVSDLYFAYGSNLSTRRLIGRVGNVHAKSVACLSDHRIAFNKPSRDGSGKANVVESAGASTWGMVFELKAQSWDVLDRFEPGYARQLHAVRSREGASIEAQLYVHTPGGPDLTPFDWYLEAILAGAREHRLPSDYVSRLESVEVVTSEDASSGSPPSS
jgi:gamma-glutamylcyclotransferase